MTDSRNLFADEREKHFPMNLSEGIIGKQVTMQEYFDVEDALEPIVFPENDRIKRWFSLPSERREAKKRLYTLQRMSHQEAVVFYEGDKAIGWSAGRMTGSSEFMMDVTGVLPDYQGKGIYSAFLRLYMPYLCDIGYERVVSYHSPTNRAVLIAKLKVGFNISAMELREHAGASVKLVYFLHQDRLLTFENVHSLQADNTRKEGEQS